MSYTKKPLNEFVQMFYQRLPDFRGLDCFLRGLNFHGFFLDNLPDIGFRITFCGSLDRLQSAAESHDIRLIGELSGVPEPIFLYEIGSEKERFEIEHFRTIDSLEAFLNGRPLGFQHSLYSLRLEEEIGVEQSNGSFSLSFRGVIDKDSEDLMDLLRVCLCKQKIPSQILGSELMPQISADSLALNLLLNEWLVNYRVGSIINDLHYFNCLPGICEDLLSKSLPGIRWYEQNQSLIEEAFSKCLPDEQLNGCKAFFYLCISSQADIDVLNSNDEKVFISLIIETQDWWLARLQGENLNTGLIESWIIKFRHQYKLAAFFSCLMTVHKYKESTWFNLGVCFSQIVEIMLEITEEENHVSTELSHHLDREASRDLQIKALIESWGGRLRTRKQWQNFLGLN